MVTNTIERTIAMWNNNETRYNRLQTDNTATTTTCNGTKIRCTVVLVHKKCSDIAVKSERLISIMKYYVTQF